MRGAFDRAVEIDAVVGRRAVSSHFESCGTDRNAFVIELFSRAGRIGMLSFPWVESNDRVDLFGEQIIVNASGIVTGIIADGMDLKFQIVLTCCFDEAIGAFERESEVTFTGLPDVDVERQIVTAG